MTWRASILTLFPEMFPGPLGHSLADRALRRTSGRCRPSTSATSPPIGTAPLTTPRSAAAPGWSCDRTWSMLRSASVADDRPLVFLTPRGRTLAQQDVRRYAGGSGVILLCGRYEGVDQRVIEARGMEEVSIGDYVLSGGELPALVLLDAAIRLLPGVMGAADSAAEESFSERLLEYPHYTRPAEWQGRRVPDVLLSGHHAAVAAWRRTEAERTTRERRPDLWDAYTSATRLRRLSVRQQRRKELATKGPPR